MRPRPVLIYGCVMAVLIVLTTSADAANVLPDTVLIWIRLATAILGGVGGALFVQGQVTPLSDPRTKNGVPATLVPRARMRAPKRLREPDDGLDVIPDVELPR